MNFVRKSTPLLLPPATATATATSSTDHLAKLINDHPFPSSPLRPFLSLHLRPPLLTASLLDSLLTRLFAGHCHGLKALELFRFALHHPHFHPSPSSLNTTLHILTRMRDFDSAFALIHETIPTHPHLLTTKSLSILLSRLSRFRGFEETLAAFHQAEEAWRNASLPFGVDEFNVLLRAFCAQSRVSEARALFNRLHARFPPNTRTLNTLLLGFKESGNAVALDLFYHEAILRGLEPDTVTYNIRIDAYCKIRRFADGLVLFEEMERKNCTPTLATLTTLIHGAGIAGNIFRARELFDEIPKRGLALDRGAYNALMGALLKGRELKASVEVMEEMEEKGFVLDDVTYYTMLCGMKRFGRVEDVCKLYRRMVERGFVPRPRTVMLLMKVFCEKRRAGLALEMWDYLVEKGCCPHGHVLDLLVTELCSSGKVVEAFRYFKQMVEKGRIPSERGYRVLERFLMRKSEVGKLEELKQMMDKLKTSAPPLHLKVSSKPCLLGPLVRDILLLLQAIIETSHLPPI